MSENVTHEVKQRLDIVDVVSRYVQLKRNGSVYKGLCPFHSERTPSFVVFPQTGTWRCFGACGTGGDLFSFVMRKENLDFRDALEMLAAEAGIELKRQDESGGGSTAPLYDVNEAAADYFAHVLEHHPGAEQARQYLERRGIDQPTRELFRLGFALDSWSGLRDHLLSHGNSVEVLVEAGLIKRSEDRSSTYDMFRGRLVFPIRDRQGRVIGFGGRVLDDSIPKYLNTSETVLFHKSHVVYGLDLAYRTVREHDQVVIVEGYMDVIAAHQHGFTNVVACMGTALTPEQLRQLQYHTGNFVLALDADAAGQQATLRGLNQARQSLSRVRKPIVLPSGTVRFEERLGANLFITTMPAGKDPDDIIRANPAGWPEIVATAKPLVDFYFDVVADAADLGSAQGKGLVVAELAPLIAELGDDIEREHYIQRLSRLVQIDEITIAGRVQAAAQTSKAGLATWRRGGGTQARYPSTATDGGEQSADAEPTAPSATLHTRYDQEAHLLTNLLGEESLLIWLAGFTDRTNLPAISTEDWTDAENREIFRALKLYLSSDEPWDLELFQEVLAPALHPRLARLMAYAAQHPQLNLAMLQEDSAKVLLRMRIERLKTETRNIKYLLDELQRNGELEVARSFDRINNQHLRDIAHLQTIMARLPQELNRRSLPTIGLRIR